MSTLAELARLVDGRVVGDDLVEVHDVVFDSRRVEPGSLFCCIRGEHHDGHDHAADAVAAGAVALLCSGPVGVDVDRILVDDVRRAMAPVAAHVHGDPSAELDVVGVTGTNGKTTIVSMISSILDAAGRSNRAIGTLTGARTTPEAPDLQRLLRHMVDDGVTAVAMEVSSHALALHRVDGVHVDVAVFTNLGSDHLDFHGTPEAYFAAKARLFEPTMSRLGLVNMDDIHGRLLSDALGGAVTGVSLDDVDDLDLGRDGCAMTWRGHRLSVPMVGRHNATNALLAAEACRLLGVGEAAIVAGLAALPAVPGRFEVQRSDDGVSVVVDYAHTPDALEQALLAAATLRDPSARLAVVFGCGGERDQGKRSVMGRVASRLADRVVVTDDNPRSEDPDRIVEQILSGVPEGRAEVVRDRGRAIALAVAEAGPGDVVLVAGKGHETGQQFADRVEPFDDAEVVARAVAARDREVGS